MKRGSRSGQSLGQAVGQTETPKAPASTLQHSHLRPRGPRSGGGPAGPGIHKSKSEFRTYADDSPTSTPPTASSPRPIEDLRMSKSKSNAAVAAVALESLSTPRLAGSKARYAQRPAAKSVAVEVAPVDQDQDEELSPASVAER